MGARARLQLREEMPHMALDRLLRQEEPLADLAVHEAVRDQLKNLDLPHRRLLFELAERALEGNDLCGRAVSTPRGHRLEPAGVVGVAVEDLFALCCVHGPSIGGSREPL